METVNSNPAETAAVPEAVAAPAAPTAPAVTPTVPAAPVVKGELPKTSGTTVGGWNRFAGYKPGEQKNKKNDRGDRGKGRR